MTPQLPDLTFRLRPDPVAPERTVTVAGIDPGTTLGELAGCAGLGRAGSWEVDGRRLPAAIAVTESAVRTGSVVAPTTERSGPVHPPVVWLVAVAGPDTGRVAALAPGRHVVGAAPGAACRFADAELASHHALLDVHLDGTVTVTDLGVGRPVECDGVILTERTPVAMTGRLVVGATVLVRRSRLGPDTSNQHRPTPGGWVVPVRRVARRSDPDPAPVAAPRLERAAPHDRGGGTWLSALTTLATAVVAALVFGQPLLLLLAGVGAVGAGVTAALRARGRRRAAAAVAERNRLELDRFEDDRRRYATGVAHRLRRRVPWLVLEGAVRLDEPWQRRLGPGDPLTVAIGFGDVEVVPPLAGALPDGWASSGPVRLPEVNVPVLLPAGGVLAIAGAPASRDAAARAVVLQAAVRLGPADLAVVVVTPRTGHWAWAEWLPHRAVPGRPTVCRPDELDGIEGIDAATRAVLVVADGAALVGDRTAPVRRLLDAVPQARLVVLVGDGEAAPAGADAVLRVSRPGHAELSTRGPLGGAGARSVQRMRCVGVGSGTATAVAARLAGFADPEAGDDARPLPSEVSITALLGSGATSAASVAAGWEHRGPDPRPVALLGVGGSGPLELDLVADGPHALIAGTTGAGKSELLRSLVVGLAAASPPDLLSFVLVDYKGGSAFDCCDRLPHVVGVVTDLDHRLGARVLASLEAELRHRERVLRSAGAADLEGYRRSGFGGDPLARLVVVVDEFATLAAELPAFLPALVGLAQRGRSLGIHLVLATQRPAGVLSDDIRANTGIRIALRVQDAGDSLDVVGDRLAVRLPRDVPGRAALRLGSEPPVVFQAARCTGPAADPHRAGLRLVGPGGVTPDSTGLGGPTELDRLVERIDAAATAAGRARARRPWCDALPTRLDDAGVPGGAVGVIDDVDRQRRVPLVWDRAGGHLLVAGAPGAGVSSTLVAVAVTVAAAAAGSDDRPTVFGLDGAAAGGLSRLEPLDHCGGIVPGDDPERLAQLFLRLERVVAESAGGSAVVVVDGVGALRNRLAHPEHLELADRLDQLVLDAAAGSSLRFVFGAERVAAVPAAWVAACPTRWVGSTGDPMDALAAGYPSAAALGTAAPAGRFLVGRSEHGVLEAQVVEPAVVDRRAGAAPPAISPVARLQAVSRRIEVASLPPAGPGPDGSVVLPIGCRVADLEPAVLVLHEGDHLVVAGGPRTGRSSALRLLAEQWVAARPDAAVELVDARRRRAGCAEAIARLAAAPPDTAAVLLVDDADRLDDPDGSLARLLREDRPGFHVVAAGRPEALRATGSVHWTAAVRRSRRGLLLGAVQDIDADALGVHLPRRSLPRAPVPTGRALFVAEGRVEPVQLALPAGCGLSAVGS